MQNNTNERNSEFFKDPVILERMLLHYLELQNHSHISSNKVNQTIDIYPEESNASKQSHKFNLLSIYVIATTLLLLPLSFNYAMKSNSGTVIASDSAYLNQNLEILTSLQGKIEKLEAQLEVSTQVSSETQAFRAPLPVVQSPSAPLTVTVAEPNLAAGVETQLLPVPFLPPIFTPTVTPPVVTNPLSIPHPLEPAAEFHQSILLTSEVVQVAKTTPEKQWLGQTSTVYFSSTFDLPGEQNTTASASVEEVSAGKTYVAVEMKSDSSKKADTNLVQEKLETPEAIAQSVAHKTEVNTANKKVEAINLDLLAKVEAVTNTKSDSLFSDEELAKHLTSAPLLDDFLVKEKLGTSFAVAQSITPESESDKTSKKVEVINLDLLAKAEAVTNTKSDSLFSDEELAKHLTSAPLLDDLLVKEQLGTSFAVAKNITPESESDKTSEKVEVINLNFRAEVKNTSAPKSDSLFSDEELAKHLTSAPLLDDRSLKQRLATSTPSKPNISKQTSLPNRKIDVINLTLLSQENIEATANDNSDLRSYLTIRSKGK